MKQNKLFGLLIVIALIAIILLGSSPTLAAPFTQSATQTRTATATAVITPTNTTVPLAAPTSTVTPTKASTAVPPTATLVVTPTATLPKPTATQVVTATVKPTATITPTAVVAPTATVTKTATITPTAVVSPTATVTKTATITPTATVTKTATVTPTKPMALAPRAGPPVSLSTMFSVQNMESTSAIVTANFYDPTGTAPSDPSPNVPIDSNRSVLVDQRLSNGGLGTQINWKGGVVLSSNTQLAAVVNELANNAASLGSGFRMDTYTGISGTQAATTTVLLPQLVKNIVDPNQGKTYNSSIAVQNTLASSTNVTITYFGQMPPNVGLYTHTFTLPGNASIPIDLSSATDEPALPITPTSNTFYGSGLVSANASVAVIVNQNAGGSLTAYPGFTSANAATTLYIPQLVRNIFDPGQGLIFGTGLMVMKLDPLDPTPVNVTIAYTNQFTGRTVSDSGQLNASVRALTFDQRLTPVLGNENPFYGSATITASGPVVAVVNVVTEFDPTLGGRATTYRAFAAGGGSRYVFIPQLFKSYYDSGTGVALSTAFAGRLMSGTSGTVRVTYFYVEGGTQKQTTFPDFTLSPAVPMLTLDQRPGYDTRLPSGTFGSAVICATQPIAVSVNTVGQNGIPGDAAGTYAGVNSSTPPLPTSLCP